MPYGEPGCSRCVELRERQSLVVDTLESCIHWTTWPFLSHPFFSMLSKSVPWPECSSLPSPSSEIPLSSMSVQSRGMAGLCQCVNIVHGYCSKAGSKRRWVRPRECSRMDHRELGTTGGLGHDLNCRGSWLQKMSIQSKSIQRPISYAELPEH